MNLRVNSTSPLVASATKIFLEKTFNRRFDFAVSTRNFVMLDFDCKEDALECYNEALELAKALSEKYQSKCYIYRTPNGYHLICVKWMNWKEVEKVLKAFLTMIKEGSLKYLDQRHIEACLRRGYITLRLNQRYLQTIVEFGEGEVVVYELF